jgi:hypothetical protein
MGADEAKIEPYLRIFGVAQGVAGIEIRAENLTAPDGV